MTLDDVLRAADDALVAGDVHRARRLLAEAAARSEVKRDVKPARKK